MARIRTIKPEFWDSPSTAAAGPWARLLFIAMWNWADDHGRGTANLKELEGFAFPHDDTFTDRSGNTVNFRSCVAEVSACFGVLFYEVDGRPYYEIPSWDRHQRNERRSTASKYPGPPDNAPPTSGNTGGAEIPYISATEERKIAEAPNISGAGTGEQGNRGTGEQKPSSSGTAGRTETKKHTNTYPAEFEQWWNLYPHKKGSKHAASQKFKAALKTTTMDVLTETVTAYAQSVADRDPKYVMNGETWLSKRMWETAPQPQPNTGRQQVKYVTPPPRSIPNNPFRLGGLFDNPDGDAS